MPVFVGGKRGRNRMLWLLALAAVALGGYYLLSAPPTVDDPDHEGTNLCDSIFDHFF